MSTNAKQSPIYGDWRVLNTVGELMFRTGEKRANWYLKRELATQVDERTIQLNFEAAGPGHIGDDYYLESRPNICVVCGRSGENLNRHHIVPYQYRRWFSVELKTYSSYDVQAICLDHHEEYEGYAQEFSRQLAEEYGTAAAHGCATEGARRASKPYRVRLAVVVRAFIVPPILISKTQTYNGTTQA
jgi:hypothetical protein